MKEPSRTSPENSEASPMTRPTSMPCQACNGHGIISHQKMSGMAKATCGACGGSGVRGDSLSKVIGQPNFDLRK